MIVLDLKMVLVIRTDLKMSKGKIAAQASHAAVSATEKCRQTKPKLLSSWLILGQKKVVVGIPSLEEMKRLKKECNSKGFISVLIQDAGLTQLPPGTTTALGIGHVDSKTIDPLTRHLKLL